MEVLNTLLSIDANYYLIAGLVVFYSLEHVLHNQFSYTKKPKHLWHNLLFQVVFYLGNILWAGFVVLSIDWLNDHHVGLFYVWQVPGWIKLVAGIALFDLVTYWFHRASHKVPLLWRFHRVHHSDTKMDVSTTFRNHPVEFIFWFGGSNIIAAAIFGLDNLSLGLYALVAMPFLFLEHTNLRFPTWLDKTLGLVLTTPNLHKVHHEQDQYHTDSNFADIFILWDRLFGTYTYKSAADIQFGLKEFEEDRQQHFWYLFKSPFISIHRTSPEELLKPEPGKT
jgi:sterol desaturase/sphingolipid hydroxylase (fatty acid hydroxylase superfamily)